MRRVLLLYHFLLPVSKMHHRQCRGVLLSRTSSDLGMNFRLGEGSALLSLSDEGHKSFP